MTGIAERVRRDPGGALLALAILAVIALYAPTLGRGLVNFDDPWLVQSNWIVQQPSSTSVHAILFDLGRDTRAVLGAEYLPVRDLSILVDFAVWGDGYQGFHLTNLVLYLAAIVLWFAALTGFGIDRRVVGLAILVWAVHPSHAESVAWISERKGLLAAMFAGLAALGYSRFRSGRRAGWLVLAMLAAVAAVWSKAPSAFALAALAALELMLPERRHSVRRALTGLGAIAIVAAAAFVPVLTVASRMSVIAPSDDAPASWLAMVLGTFGFYVQLGAMTLPNAVSYPIASDGPSAIDLVLGIAGLLAAIGVVIVPRRGRWQPSPVVRAASLIWLLGWFPVSRLVLPVKAVVVADRYLMFPSLGLALAVAVGVCSVTPGRMRLLLGAVIVLAASLRTIDAQATWRDPVTLWERAVASNPADSNAWSMYVEALVASGDDERAADAVARGRERAPSARLLMHEALLVLRTDRPRGMELMRQASDAGEPKAMINYAVLLADQRQSWPGLQLVRRAVVQLPLDANAHRIHGKLALILRGREEALAAFERAYALEPMNLVNRVNLGLALIELKRPAEARVHLEAALADPRLAASARSLLARIPP
ncbi:MAG: Transrane and repeat-containing protein 3 [Myxococcales bacterium]|nr:Transrane and repeat-containing protein 3 [Myxococcales bacterium]